MLDEVETLQRVRGDVRDPASLEKPMEGVDVVVSAVQGFMGPSAPEPAFTRSGEARSTTAQDAYSKPRHPV